MSRHLTDSDFRNDAEKWEFLRTAPAIDAQEPAVRDVARDLFRAVGGHPERFVRLAAAYCRDVIEYQTDTDRVGQEDIQPKGELSDILARGIDDCDGKARLFVALCLAVGLDAEMVDHWKRDDLAPGGFDLFHVSAKVKLGGKLVPVELTLYRARVGDDPAEVVPKEVAGPFKGHWLRNDAPK
jgi:transglutaminase-like putative cysteine protease